MDFYDLWFRPHKWPVWLRRTWLLTLPISAPLWFAGWIVVTVVGGIFIIGIIAAIAVVSVWTGKPFDDAGELVFAAWKKPQPSSKEEGR